MPRLPLTRRWTEQEVELLKRLWQAGASPRAIAVRLRRSRYGVWNMACKLKLPSIKAGAKEA